MNWLVARQRQVSEVFLIFLFFFTKPEIIF